MFYILLILSHNDYDPKSLTPITPFNIECSFLWQQTQFAVINTQYTEVDFYLLGKLCQLSCIDEV